MTAKPARSPRVRELARIHCLVHELKLADDQYRAVLWAVARVDSAAQLDAHGRQQVIAQLQSHLPKTRRYPQRPHNADVNSREELKKIEALLTDAGRSWAYAESILRHMTRGRKERLTFADPRERAAVIAALQKDALKRLRSALSGKLLERGCSWGWAEMIAKRDYGLGFKATLECDAECMSLVLRQLQAELQP